MSYVTFFNLQFDLSTLTQPSFHAMISHHQVARLVWLTCQQSSATFWWMVCLWKKGISDYVFISSQKKNINSDIFFPGGKPEGKNLYERLMDKIRRDRIAQHEQLNKHILDQLVVEGNRREEFDWLNFWETPQGKRLATDEFKRMKQSENFFDLNISKFSKF